jgi:o-succinylbenzoate---CoA ligase
MDSNQMLNDLPDCLHPLLASYKVPKQWILTPDLPRTAQGKLSRPQVLVLAQSILGLKS